MERLGLTVEFVVEIGYGKQVAFGSLITWLQAWYSIPSALTCFVNILQLATAVDSHR